MQLPDSILFRFPILHTPTKKKTERKVVSVLAWIVTFNRKIVFISREINA